MNSGNSSAPGETGRQSQVCESSVARPQGSEAAPRAAAASGGGPLTTGARDEGQAKAAIAHLAEPSLEAEKNPPAGKTGRDLEVGVPSIAVASFDGAALDPLREASAALDDGDYATAQRLFAAIGRRDVAEAIKDALAALDRRDYATAQALFEALGQKGAAAAQVKGTAPASSASPKPAAPAGGPMGSVSLNEPRQKPVISPPEAIPVTDAAHRRPLPQAEKAKSRRLKPLLAGTGLVILAIFGVSAIYGSPLNWKFSGTKGQAIGRVLTPPKSEAAPNPSIVAKVDEDLDYRIAAQSKTADAWRAFVDAHPNGSHAQEAQEALDKLKLPHPAPPPPPPPKPVAVPLLVAPVVEVANAEPRPPDYFAALEQPETKIVEKAIVKRRDHRTRYVTHRWPRRYRPAPPPFILSLLNPPNPHWRGKSLR